MKVELQGRIVDLEPSELDAAGRARIVAEGTFLFPNGEPMTGAALSHARRYFVRDDGAPTTLGQSRALGERRWLIEGLWPIGTIPLLGGSPKVGKTTLVVDLVASLLTPGRRFLNHFEPANRSADPRHGENLFVWVINAETPPDDFEAALVAAGVDAGNPWLSIDHLEDMGGAQLLDLPDPRLYARWESRMVECDRCDGSDFWTPSVVIVDGVTAILNAAGRGVESTGVWYAAFRRLMRALDVPNALAVGHNTLAGDHLMGGVEAQAGADGLWNYATQNGARYFWTVPRLGGPRIERTRVDQADGRLTVHEQLQTKSESTAAPDVGESDDSAQREHEVIEALTTAGTVGAMTTELTGRGRWGLEKKAALLRLEEKRMVRRTTEGQGFRWHLLEETGASGVSVS